MSPPIAAARLIRSQVDESPRKAGGPLNRDQGDCGTSHLLRQTAHPRAVKEVKVESEVRLVPQVLTRTGSMGATEEAETARLWPGGK